MTIVTLYYAMNMLRRSKFEPATNGLKAKQANKISGV
jgi:hypothetical protein